MQLKTLLLVSYLGFFSILAVAGGGHEHGHGHSHSAVNQDVAKAKATKIVVNFVNKKIVDESWLLIPADSVEKKKFNGTQEWVVSFVNKNAVDAKKTKLYVFLTLAGDYIAANYSGK